MPEGDTLHRVATRPRPALVGETLARFEARRPCLRCGSAIEVTRTGRDGRIVYWCPYRQPSPVTVDRHGER